VRSLEVTQLLIPKVGVYKHRDGYVVYIPERFNEFLPKKAILTVLVDNDKILVGIVTLFKANAKKYAIKLPKRLSYIWDRLVNENKEVSLILEKLNQGV
jgi:hypothetical protein